MYSFLRNSYLVNHVRQIQLQCWYWQRLDNCGLQTLLAYFYQCITFRIPIMCSVQQSSYKLWSYFVLCRRSDLFLVDLLGLQCAYIIDAIFHLYGFIQYLSIQAQTYYKYTWYGMEKEREQSVWYCRVFNIITSSGKNNLQY